MEDNEVVQASPEPQVAGEDGERVEEGLGSSSEPEIIIAGDKEIKEEISGEAPELQTRVGEMESAVENPQTTSEMHPLDEPQLAQTSSESQIVAEETEATRPSLDEVWKSIKANEPQEPLAFQEPQELQDEAKEKGIPSESPQISQHVPEIKERPRPSSLRTRPSTRAKRNVTFKDDFEKVEEEKVHKPGVKRHAGGPQPKVPPACLGLFLAVALASLIVYIASPKNVPTKPVSNHQPRFRSCLVYIVLDGLF